MFTKKLFWVLVIGFLNLVSVDAKERSIEEKIDENIIFSKNILLKQKKTSWNFTKSIKTPTGHNMYVVQF